LANARQLSRFIWYIDLRSKTRDMYLKFHSPLSCLLVSSWLRKNQKASRNLFANLFKRSSGFLPPAEGAVYTTRRLQSEIPVLLDVHTLPLLVLDLMATQPHRNALASNPLMIGMESVWVKTGLSPEVALEDRQRCAWISIATS
jgi:hypothetical protein